MEVDIVVPDIGEHKDLAVTSLHVAPGDTVSSRQTLLTLEGGLNTLGIPAPFSGKVYKLSVNTGDKVSQGEVVLTLLTDDAEGKTENDKTATDATNASSATATMALASNAIKKQPVSQPWPPPRSLKSAEYDCDVLVLGAGPGGYSAAFRAADLGKKVILVERYETLGGVCLNVGCIPSKSLLHLASVINDASECQSQGISFAKPQIDINKIREWKAGVVSRLTSGLKSLASQRKVKVVRGVGRFRDEHSLVVEESDSESTFTFSDAIIAVGSQPQKIPGIPDDPRIFDSTGALSLNEIPASLLVVGGGIIGLEMATVYSALGSRVVIVEMMDTIMPGTDRDLVRPLLKRMQARGINFHTATRVAGIDSQKEGLMVSFAAAGGGDSAPSPGLFNAALISTGRQPNGQMIGADNAGIKVDERGFILVDKQMRTSKDNIYAIGDVVGNPMLAHKAVHEAKVAAEVIAGHQVTFSPECIPSVAYTDPEVAWSGLSETEAREKGIEYEKAVFPWAASGRALSMDRAEGMTKLLFDPKNNRILGGAIVGKSAGDLIGEICLAIEYAADISDLALTIHPHPTLCETIGFAAEVGDGTITDMLVSKRQKKIDI